MEQIDIRQELRAMTDGMSEWVGRRHQRRQRMARAVIGVTTAVALVVIFLQPQPDGQFLSDPSQRSLALGYIDQASLMI